MSYAALYDKAVAAGKEAAMKRVPTPMVVGRAVDLYTNEMVPGTQEVVMDGVCGFAWVNIKPGNSAFANWLKKNGLARKDSYAGGVTVWVGDYNQSMEKKEAYADAFAEVLRDNGIDRAYAQSRMD